MVSIIIPVYNAEAYLARCLNSIINQTYSNIEIILVNDGSVDASEHICLEYANVENRIRYIYKDNEGAGAARYFGAGKATGDYLLFVDSDDYLTSNAIEILLNGMAPDVDCVIGQHRRFGSSKVIKQVEFPTGVYDFEDSVGYKTYVDEIVNDRHGVELWNKLFRADIVKKAWRYPITVNFGEDMLYLTEIFLNCRKIKCIENVTYYYEFRDNSLARSTYNLMILPEFATECLRLEKVICERRLLCSVYPLIVYHILSFPLAKYIGHGLQVKRRLISDIEKIADLEVMRHYAKQFLRSRRKLKKLYKLDNVRYYQASALYKSILYKDAWYYTRLYPAMLEKKFSWIFIFKAYINKIIGRVEK